MYKTNMNQYKFPYPYNLVHDINHYMSSCDSNWVPNWDSSAGSNEPRCPELESQEMSADQIKGLEYALSMLPDRQRNVILAIYREQKATKDIAAEYEITSTRVGSIADVSIELLHRQAYFIYIQYGFEGAISHKLSLENAHSDEMLKATDISQLGLSNHHYHALKRGKIHTVYDLCNRTQEELLKIRNFGKTSVLETEQALSKFGLCLLPFKNTAYPYNLVSAINNEFPNERPICPEIVNRKLEEDHIKGLEHALTMIPKMSRDVLVARYKDGRSVADIAGEYGASSYNIRQLINDTIAQLGKPSFFAFVRDGYEKAKAQQN